MNKYTVTVCTVILLCLAGCGGFSMESITIEDGETVRGSRNTINGDILVGSDCDVNGDLRTVNGRIDVGRNSKMRDIEVVNGSIRIAEDVLVRGDAQTVNGSIRIYPGTTVEGEVYTINGEIDLDGVTVERDVSTYAGDIILAGKTTVRGNIYINDRDGDDRERLAIEVTDGAVVEGDVIVKDDRTEVTVYISNGGEVKGRIDGAEVVRR